jgi:HTH-type transcriptional regulator/antitoxin MqsA
MDKQICPLCTHMMERAEKPMTLSHKGYTATFDMPGWYCAECGESVHTGKDMQTSDRRLNTLKAQAENLLVPQEVRRDASWGEGQTPSINTRAVLWYLLRRSRTF